MEPKTYRFGEFQLEEERRQLLRNSEPVSLSSRSFDLLVCLVKNAGKLVARDDLFKTVWGENSNTNDEVLTDAMSKLRGALKDDKKPYKLIETIHRKGYQFIASVEEARNPINQSEALSTPIEEDSTLAKSDNLEEPKAEFQDRMRTFGEWMRNSGRRVTLLFIVSVPLSIVASFFVFRSILNLDDTQIFTISTSITHVIIIGIAIVYNWLYPGTTTFPPDEWTQARRVAISTLEQYKADWVFLLLFWGLLYAFRVLMTSNTQVWLPAVLTGANNINTLLIFRCFNTLNKSNTLADNPHDNITFVTVLYCILIIICFFVEVSFTQYEETFKLFSGISAATAMALYFGRFQSRFLKSPPWLLILFYFYVAIQPLFVYFDKPQYANIIIPLALFLKCLLILYMFWLFESRRLLFYLVRVRRTDTEVDKEYEDFNKIWT
ncbi:MAG TPA: transcriptional regulator [Pyrinomonadaceae bacterium]|jgi:DNA-binding winged helix-turn-helix (wHTH) protein